MRQLILPARLDQTLSGDGIDIISQRQGDDIGIKAVDNSTGLLAGTAVGLFNRYSIPGFLLPVRGKGLVEIRYSSRVGS